MTRNKMYEGMFLVDSALANTDLDGIIKFITTVLNKADAEIISIKKWDERKLTYDIKGVARGTYILSYFKVNGDKIRDIENAVQLSEKILRVLILNADHMTAEDIEKAISQTPVSAASQDEEKEVPQGQEEDEEEQSQDDAEIEQEAEEDSGSDDVLEQEAEQDSESDDVLEQEAEEDSESDDVLEQEDKQ